jgi:hypothetical protein
MLLIAYSLFIVVVQTCFLSTVIAGSAARRHTTSFCTLEIISPAEIAVLCIF